MKTRILFSILVSVCIMQAAHAGVKRALIIGIDHYQATDQTPAALANRGDGDRAGWKNLSGCINDARSVKQLCMARYGFPEQNIDTLMDRQATHETILNALNALVGNASNLLRDRKAM